MLEILDAVFGCWIGRAKTDSKLGAVAFVVAIPIWSLFGLLLVGAGLPAIWPQAWSGHRVGGLVMFAIGLLLIVQVVVSIISALRADRTVK